MYILHQTHVACLAIELPFTIEIVVILHNIIITKCNECIMDTITVFEQNLVNMAPCGSLSIPTSTIHHFYSKLPSTNNSQSSYANTSHGFTSIPSIHSHQFVYHTIRISKLPIICIIITSIIFLKDDNLLAK